MSRRSCPRLDRPPLLWLLPALQSIPPWAPRCSSWPQPAPQPAVAVPAGMLGSSTGQEFCPSCPNHLQEAPAWLKSALSQLELGIAEPWAVTGGVFEHGVPGVQPPTSSSNVELWKNTDFAFSETNPSMQRGRRFQTMSCNY